MVQGNTYIDTQEKPSTPALLRQFVGGRWGTWVAVTAALLERSRQRQALAELDDRLLDDFGVARSQADRELAKPLWSAGNA